MKRTIAFVSIVILTLFYVGCSNQYERNQRALYKAKQLQYVLHSIDYIKDTRTGFCFAYHWGGSGNGGPALATVPCETIPLELLTIPK